MAGSSSLDESASCASWRRGQISWNRPTPKARAAARVGLIVNRGYATERP
jgi:hypothetical protein